jgi:adenine deaminase
MATINIAQHFAIDGTIGGIAPGKYADIIIIPDLRTIQPECVISNGQIIAKDGELLVLPRKHAYPKSTQNSIHLPRNFTTEDFAIPVKSNRSQVKVRVIDLITDSITREAIIDMPISDGRVQPDASQDIVKVAAIERTYQQGKTFVGFVRGTGLKYGAIASSLPTDCWNIVVIGTSDADMAQAVNRIRELRGGTVVCANNKVLAELALPIGGVVSLEPMETIADKLRNIQQAAVNLGCVLPNVSNTLAFLASESVPFLRICEQGLIDIRQNRIINLMVD